MGPADALAVFLGEDQAARIEDRLRQHVALERGVVDQARRTAIGERLIPGRYQSRRVGVAKAAPSVLAQVGSFLAVAKLNAVGSVIAFVAITRQPFASVTLTVYVPTPTPLNTAAVVLFDQLYA